MNIRKIALILFLHILLLHTVSSSSINTVFKISDNEIVTETISINFKSYEEYNSFSFSTYSEPLSIISEYPYEIKKDEINSLYTIHFLKGIKKGQNTYNFSIIYDNLIQKSGNIYSFRTGFDSGIADNINLKVILPKSYSLSDIHPNVIPNPNSIETDGQNIMILWEVEEESANIAVFYEGKSNSDVLFSIIIATIIIFGIFYLSKQKSKQDVRVFLSDDEISIIDLLKKGKQKQKDIAKELEFSKSKMSKVVRKLEEKKIIEKEPYFKTNIIKLIKNI